ncbi:hypothetical protein WH47_00237 [Habropoda laboriosa]|uniref:Uncharacterized protein n=1 Tax=Habropoda laboriosa TaxID=597456 RepID=A0A0L7R1L3_9HYME|nr:hypothetical protein WH47_00237 [Habropoda laboriosa]
MPAYKLKPVWDPRRERLRCFDNCWKVARFAGSWPPRRASRRNSRFRGRAPTVLLTPSKIWKKFSDHFQFRSLRNKRILHFFTLNYSESKCILKKF